MNAHDDGYTAPVLPVSVAAQVAGMHAQTLRQYDRLGLVVPARTAGRGRRYSQADIDALREIQRLSLEGINLEGIRRILSLEREVRRLEQTVAELRSDSARTGRVFAASASGDVEPLPLGRRTARLSPAVLSAVAVSTSSTSTVSTSEGTSRTTTSRALIRWPGARR